MAYYKADDVRAAVRGKWLEVLLFLAPELEPALRKVGKHVTCPVHGTTKRNGKGDGFRLFKDAHETGGGVCNHCGSFHDGFELLMWLNRWEFKEALAAVGEFLGVEQHLTYEEKQEQRDQQRVTACGSSAQAQGQAHAQPVNTAATTTTTTTTSSAPASPAKVIPMRDKKAAWLEEVQQKLEKDAERRREYGARLHDRIAELWGQCMPMDCNLNEPMRAYFHNRGLLFRWEDVQQSDSVRFHPALSYFDEDGKETGKYPAIVCAIRDKEGQLITLHRIYLSDKGKKARVPNAKKMMPVPDGLEVTGGAIRLGVPSEGILGVAEGVETALAAFRACHIPVWATVNATLMERFEVPEGVHTVLIWADKDKSLTGEMSANALKARLEAQGLNVFILMPPLPIPARAKGIDWNDVLLSQGTLAFPRKAQIQSIITHGASYGCM